jgi:hypothetical protein
VVLSQVADDGARAAGSGLVPVTAKGATVTAKAAPKAAVTSATRTSKVKEILAHAEDIDAKDLLDQLENVWDLTQALDDDEDDEVDKKFRTLGVDFRGDVVPSLNGQPLPGIEGASRTLLSDGHALVPAGRLPASLAVTTLAAADRHDLVFGGGYLSPGWAYYVELPLPPSVGPASDRDLLLVRAEASDYVAWDEVAVAGKTSPPPVLEQGARRYVRIKGGAAAEHLVLIRARPDAGP